MRVTRKAFHALVDLICPEIYKKVSRQKWDFFEILRLKKGLFQVAGIMVTKVHLFNSPVG